MQPLKISCQIDSGNFVSTDGLLPLDSLLAAEWIRRNYPEQFFSDGAKGGVIDAQLPLAEVRMGGVDIWAASVAQYHLYGEYTAYWHKRFDDLLAGQYLDKLKRIDVGSGLYKNYRMPLNVMIIGEMTWFAVGDLDAVRDLLIGITAIGKKRAYGYGMIALDHGRPAWTVEPWAEDWSIRGPQGKLMRSIPWDGVTSGTVRKWGIKPPFWLPSNQLVAEIPKVGDWDANTD